MIDIIYTVNLYLIITFVLLYTMVKYIEIEMTEEKEIFYYKVIIGNKITTSEITLIRGGDRQGDQVEYYCRNKDNVER